MYPQSVPAAPSGEVLVLKSGFVMALLEDVWQGVPIEVSNRALHTASTTSDPPTHGQLGIDETTLRNENLASRDSFPTSAFHNGVVSRSVPMRVN